MLCYALEHGAPQSTLHKIFYHGFRDRYPWLPTMIVKGCYIDALRRARSSRELKRRGKAGKDRPGIRSIKITYSDPQDWRLEKGCVEVKHIESR